MREKREVENMYYSAIGALGIMILCFENHDILCKRNKNITVPTWRAYRQLLHAVLFFYVMDVLWGVFDTLKLRMFMFVDTLLYFTAMSLCVLL